MSGVVPATVTCANGKTCWKPVGRAGRDGFKYTDRKARQHGISSIGLRPGAEGKARVLVSGKGASLSLPPARGADRLLLQDPIITVQLGRTDAGGCWEAVYPEAAIANTTSRFKDARP